METPTNIIEIDLVKSKKKAQVRTDLIAADSLKAQRLAKNNQELYMPALISIACTIEGEPIVLEDVQLLPHKDYMALLTALTEEAF